jgi:hypothetical protein
MYRRLDRETLDFIASLPGQHVVALDVTASIRVLHGSLGSVSALLFPDGDSIIWELFAKAGLLDVGYARVGVGTVLAQIDEEVLICGHSHIPWQYERYGRLALNPGSVGAPINGDARAQYALLTWRDGRWEAEHRAIPYDLDLVRAAYRESGLLAEGGVFMRALLMCIETGQNVPGKYVAHVRKLATDAGFGDWNAVPDAIWEQAAVTFDWETAAKSGCREHRAK